MKSAAPYSPCFATITRGPISITLRVARTRFGSSVSMRSSASFRKRMSTIPIVLTSESRVDSIQKFIESSPATCAPVHCSRTSR